MRRRMLSILVCSHCKGELSCEETETAETDDILSGSLHCKDCRRGFPITNGIPRFAPADNYAASFGKQWNIFRTEQLDSKNGFQLSADRFYSETEWSPDSLAGKLALDGGCGPGRFLDVVTQTKAEVVGIDLSNAVDAARQNLRDRGNLDLVQASIYDLPFGRGTFDAVYCIGVVQHTPHPHQTMTSLASMVKKGGRIALVIYERRRWTKLFSKYWIRPLTKRMSHEALLPTIRYSMPVLFPITEVAFRIPYANKLFRHAIPVCNYVGAKDKQGNALSMKQRYQWAVMDTFDMLSPEYDNPQTMAEVEAALKSAGVGEIRRTDAPGLSVEARRLA